MDVGNMLQHEALRGRAGGDYDLSRLLRRTRWGAGGGSNSLAQGCTVADIIAAMEDPLQRGCCFRNVSERLSIPVAEFSAHVFRRGLNAQ